MLKQKSLYTEYAGGKGTFKKQKLFFFFSFSTAVQQCGEFATCADVQYIESGFFFPCCDSIFCQSLRSHTFMILMFNWYQ